MSANKNRAKYIKIPDQGDAQQAWAEHYQRNKESIEMVIPIDLRDWFAMSWRHRWLIQRLTIAISVRNTILVEALDSLESIDPEDLTTFETQLLKLLNKIKEL